MSPLDRVPKDAVVGARSGESRVRSLPATAFFVFGAVLLLLATRVSIPALVEHDFDPLLAWFVSAGFGVFLPLFLVGWVSVRREGGRTPRDLRSDRLRFRRLDRSDWRVCGGSLAAIGLLTGLITLVMLYFKGRSVLHPAFLPGLPLSAGRYWLLGVWPVFFTANILWEEFVWRGVLLPRQESAHGRYAWVFNGAGWTAFHAAMGWQVVMLLPLSLILPYAVQRTGNTWVGVILHAAVNGPAFVAISMGA